MKHTQTFEDFLNEGNASMYKSTVVDALKQLGYRVKQSDLKIGVKKERLYDLITLNGELLCSSSDYAQMVSSIQNAVKDNPEKYGLDPKAFEQFVNEAVNPAAYVKAGKLGYNDQFLGRQSLSKTLSLDLGFDKKNEFGGGDWIGFDHVSMYATGKKGGTILDDALTGNYTYDELKSAAAKHFGI